MISVGSEVQVLPGPYFSFGEAERKVSPGRERKGICEALPRSPACGQRECWRARSCLLLAGASHINGGLAQLVEHLLCKQGVIGSNPLASMLQSWLFGLACFRSGALSERELVRCCLPSTDFLARALRPALGMFFQTVNRIWWIAAWLRCRRDPYWGDLAAGWVRDLPWKCVVV